MLKLVSTSYNEVKTKLKTMENFNVQYLFEHNYPLYEAVVRRIARLMIPGHELNSTKYEYYTPFNVAILPKFIEIVSKDSQFRNLSLDDIYFDYKMYNRIIKAKRAGDKKFTNIFYRYAKARVGVPPMTASYSLLSLNNDTNFEKIYGFGVNYGEFKPEIMPLGGLYLGLYDENNDFVPHRIFYTGWIQTVHDPDSSYAEGRFDFKPKLSVEMQDEEEYRAVGKRTVFPLFYFERIIHWYLPETVSFWTAEKTFSKFLEDKLTKITEQNRQADKNTSLCNIDITQFIDMKNTFAKYGEELDNNPENCKKTLSRVIVIPVNTNNFIPEYRTEGQGPSYHSDVSLIVGQKAHTILSRRAKDVRAGRVKSFYSHVSSYKEKTAGAPLYVPCMDYNPMMEGDDYNYGKNILNLEYFHYGDNICGISSCDGTYYYNILDNHYSARSLGDICAESVQHKPIDLKRAVHFSGLSLAQNSEQARTKGTYCSNDGHLFDQDPELKRIRAPYFNGVDHYKAPYFDKMPHSNELFYTPYPANKYKDGEQDVKKTFANILKANVRTHSQITGKNLESCPNTNIYLTLTNKKTGEVKNIELDRQLNYLPSDKSEYKKEVNYFINALTAFVPTYKTFDKSLIIEKDGQLIFDTERIDNMSNEDFEKFARHFDGADGQGRMTEELASFSLVRRSTITAPLDECAKTELLRHILSEVDKNGYCSMDFEEGYTYRNEKDDVTITVDNFKSKFKLYYDIKCQEPMCGGTLYPAMEVEMPSTRTTDIQIQKNAPNYRSMGEYLKCEKCGKTHEVNTPDKFDELIGRKQVNPIQQYSARSVVIDSYNITDKGLELYADIYVPWANSRSVDIAHKAVMNILADDYIGSFEMDIIDPNDGTEYVLSGKLDMNTLGLANKAKENGPFIWSHNLFNAVFDSPVYFSDILNKYYQQDKDYLDEALKNGIKVNTDYLKRAGKEMESVLNKHMSPATITRKYLDPDTGEEIVIKQKAHVALCQLRATEVSDEYVKVGVGNKYSRFSPMHTLFLRDIGEDDLCRALYKAREVGNNRDDLMFFEEFLKVVNHDSTPGTYVTEPKPVIQMIDITHIDDEGIDVTQNITVSQRAQSIKMSSLMSQKDWDKLLKSHDLFTDDKYEHGFVVYIPNHEYDEGSSPIDDTEFVKEHHAYLPLVFPSRKFLLNDNMVTKLPNGEIRLSNSFKNFVRTFFTLSASSLKMAHAAVEDDQYKQKNGDLRNVNTILESVRHKAVKGYDFLGLKNALTDPVKSLRNEFEKKKAFIDEITSFTLPYFSAKQIGTGYIEPGYAVVGDSFQWRQMVKHHLKKIYGKGSVQDQIKAALADNKNEFITAKTRKYFESRDTINTRDIKYFCDWYELYGYGNRDPNIFATQAIAGAVKFMNVKQADVYFKDRYWKIDEDGNKQSIRFSDIYPNFRGIMINNMDMVAGFQSDTDGDYLKSMCPADLEAQLELKKFVNKHKYYNILRKAEPGTHAYTLRDFQYQWAMTYLLDEYQTNCYGEDIMLDYNPQEDCDPLMLNIKDNVVHQTKINNTIHQGTENKTLIGTLTTSGWLFYLLFDFAKNTSLVREYNISRREFQLMSYFFQILLQDGCIRALKAAGILQHCTDSNLAMDNFVVIYDPITNTTDVRKARQLFADFANEHEELYNIEGLSKAITKMFKLMDWWRENGGFTKLDQATKLGNLYKKDNSNMKHAGMMLNSVKSFLFATSSAFQESIDGESFYTNFQLKDGNGNNLIDKIEIKEFYSDIINLILDINYYSFGNKNKISKAKHTYEPKIDYDKVEQSEDVQHVSIAALANKFNGKKED